MPYDESMQSSEYLPADTDTAIVTSPTPNNTAIAPAEIKSTPSSSAPARRASNKNTYVIVACIALLLALSVLGSLMNVGDHLMAAHPALGWTFYVLIVVLVIAGIVVPLVKVAKRPIFSLYQLRDEQGRAKQKRCQMLVDNLVANTSLTDEEVLELQGYLQQGDKADDLLIAFFTKHCTPAIHDEIKSAATTAFLVSAVSHSPLVSTVTMLSICLDLVRAIVETCGFRPTNAGLARLYARVVTSALIIGGIEDADLNDLLGQLMGGGAGARVGGMLIGATAEGLTSAFLVFRVGVITKKWLMSADGPAQMRAIRKTSYREALALMRTSGFMTTVADTVKATGSQAATAVADTVRDAARSTAEQARETAATAAAQTRDAALATMEQARETATSAAAQTRDAARATVEQARETATSAAEQTREAARATMEQARESARETFEHARESTRSKVDSAKARFLPNRPK